MLQSLPESKVIAVYGNPDKYLREDGLINERLWKSAILTTRQLPARLPLSWNRALSASKFSCHKLIGDQLERVFYRIHSDVPAWYSINDYGGCYMWRTNRNNPKVRSRHCWGLAVDLDCADNPNGAIAPQMHPRIIEYFEDEGFLWGGRFPTPDPMHFEYAGD